MTEMIRVFLSQDPGEVERLRVTLAELADVDVVEVPEAILLEGHVPLPMLETADGWRHVGMSAVEKFVASRVEGSISGR